MNKGEDILTSAIKDFYGIKEVEGPASEQQILSIINWAMPDVRDDSSVAWCAIAASYLINLYCGPFPIIKVAKSFLNVGIPVEIPQYGDLVIYWRGSKNGWQGHVGFVIRVDGDKIWTFGGNQDNAFNIKSYSEYRLEGYRRLI